MPVLDNDAAIRDRAYALWEEAGCPPGREYEHWAEARRQIEAGQPGSAEEERPVLAAFRDDASDAGPQEIIRLRQALYDPEPFSVELFGAECPRVDNVIVMRPTPHRDARAGRDSQTAA